MARTEFDRDQYAEAYPPGIERSWWHVARNRVIARTFARHVPRDARVLEVGCGTGIVTAHLRANGLDATGVDLGEPTVGVLGRDHLLLGRDALALPLAMRECIARHPVQRTSVRGRFRGQCHARFHLRAGVHAAPCRSCGIVHYRGSTPLVKCVG